MPEWLKGTGCKPVGVSLRWFESNPAHFSMRILKFVIFVRDNKKGVIFLLPENYYENEGLLRHLRAVVLFYKKRHTAEEIARTLSYKPLYVHKVLHSNQ